MGLILRKSKVFKLNRYLSVRFKGEETVIYVKRKPFITSKYLFMNATIQETVESFDYYDSIDDMSKDLDSRLERELTREEVGLLPKEEFWGHCSNLQVWVERNYNSCLLHRNLAFPLLNQLTKVGDAKARELFLLEVARRFNSRCPTVQKFLILEDYLLHLDSSTIEELIDYVDDKKVLEVLSQYFNYKNDLSNHLKTLKRMLWIDPIHYKAYLVLAFTYLRISKLLKAKLALKELLKMYPNDKEALLFLASLYQFEGKTSKAIDLIKKLELTEFSFLSRKEFLSLKSHKFSSLITEVRHYRRLYRPKSLIDFP